MKKLTWILLLTICFSTKICFSAENENDVLTALTNHGILFISQWDVGEKKPLLCILSEKSMKNDSLPIRTFSVYKQEQSGLVKIFNFDTSDYPVNFFPFQDVGDRFFTTWTGGSAYHFYAFRYIDGKVKMVLQAGSKISPEFVLDNSGNDLIIISDVTWPQGQKNEGESKAAGNSDIFRWNGEYYELIKKAPWIDRFK